jgi:hypothetical protein
MEMELSRWWREDWREVTEAVREVVVVLVVEEDILARVFAVVRWAVLGGCLVSLWTCVGRRDEEVD